MASVRNLLATFAVAVSVAACRAPDQRIAPFAEAWGAGDFAEAEKKIDALVADEAGVDPKLVTETRALDPAIDPAQGDTFLFLQEKSMTRLAAGDTDGRHGGLGAGGDEADHVNRGNGSDDGLGDLALTFGRRAEA